MTHSRNTKKGFTLVELLFSVAFIAFVMLFIVSTIVQVLQTYNKGLAVKEISQMARTTLDDMARVTRTTPYNIIQAAPAVLAANRVCFGGVSYVWNIRAAATNKYDDNTTVTFARVNDLGGTMCIKVSGNYPRVPKAQATPLLTDRIWVNKVGITLNVNAQVADLEITLSTADTDGTALDLTGPIVTCKGGSIGQFCAVADFTTTAALKVR